MCLRIGLVLIILSSLVVPQIAVSAQGGSIQLAVDAADFDQDGLLVLFGGLRRQGEIGLPVGAGDINGDGLGDVIFCGMFGSSGSRTNNGVVNVYISDGRTAGLSTRLRIHRASSKFMVRDRVICLGLRFQQTGISTEMGFAIWQSARPLQDAPIAESRSPSPLISPFAETEVPSKSPDLAHEFSKMLGGF